MKVSQRHRKHQDLEEVWRYPEAPLAASCHAATMPDNSNLGEVCASAMAALATSMQTKSARNIPLLCDLSSQVDHSSYKVVMAVHGKREFKVKTRSGASTSPYNDATYQTVM